MDFRVLTYFTVVARELNFTRAAEKLNMSQPPLSNSIRQLEEDLGVELFIRGKRHLTLTEEGAFFLHRAQESFLGRKMRIRAFLKIFVEKDRVPRRVYRLFFFYLLFVFGKCGCSILERYDNRGNGARAKRYFRQVTLS